MTLKKHSVWLRFATAALVFTWLACKIQAQSAQDYIVNQFDDGTTGGWSPNYGAAPMTVEFDPNENRGPVGNGPGALKCTINFDLCTYGGDNQRDWERSITPTLDLTKYTKLHFSMKVDPSSSHLSDWGGGAFGNVHPHIRLASWGGDTALGSDGGGSQWIGTDAYGQWVDYTYNIDQTLDNLATRQAMGVWGFQVWSGWGTCAAPIGHTNTVIFWLDNIWFELNTNTAPPLPPTLTLEKSSPPGVEVIMDDKSDQWQRNAIVTPAGNSYIWTGQGSYPVTYSCTISDFPDKTAHPGFEAHMYIVNGDTVGGNTLNGASDYVSPDLFIFRVENVTGGAMAQIQWKTNYPNANATNIPVVVTVPNILGTWSVTFTDSTHGSLTGPGLTATNFTLPSDAVANYLSPGASHVQFGMFKNDGANDGHNNNAHGTFSGVQISGGSASINDNFNGATLTNNYAWRTTSGSAVQHIPPGTQWLVNWTVPASGFNLETAANVTGPWAPANVTRTYQGSGNIHALIPQIAGNAAYFRLVKRPFVKLQVLLPGESNAPNTVSGKTGTPTDQTAGVAFNVIVNAVDQFWNVVPATDTIHITSTDGTATLPADAAIFNGSGTFSVTLNTAGSYTVTATDVTDGTKTANTSSSVNAQ